MPRIIAEKFSLRYKTFGIRFVQMFPIKKYSHGVEWRSRVYFKGLYHFSLSRKYMKQACTFLNNVMEIFSQNRFVELAKHEGNWPSQLKLHISTVLIQINSSYFIPRIKCIFILLRIAAVLYNAASVKPFEIKLSVLRIISRSKKVICIYIVAPCRLCCIKLVPVYFCI